MTEKPTKKHSTTSQSKRIRSEALKIIKQDPTLTDYSVNQELIQKGLVKAPNYLYQRVPHRQLIRRDLAAVREAFEGQLAYEMMPLAMKEGKKALKDKDLGAKDKYPYVKLTFDKYFGEKERTWTPGNINLTAIQQYNAQTINVQPQDVVLEGESEVIEVDGEQCEQL